MKFCGVIGYVSLVETVPGVWTETGIAECHVKGDVVKNYMKLQNSSNANSDIDINNEFRVLISSQLRSRIESIRYITWMGTKWRVTSVDLASYPRAIIQVGGVYNENSYTIS